MGGADRRERHQPEDIITPGETGDARSNLLDDHETSQPRRTGNGGVSVLGVATPCRVFQSTGSTPAPRTSISTSPAAASGRGASSYRTTSGPPQA